MSRSKNNVDRLRHIDGLVGGSTGYTVESNIGAMAASPLLSAVYWQPSDLNESGVINSNGCCGTLMATAPSGTSYMDVVLPYMVVIGDSISEGHPALHGRLHDSPLYNPANTNDYGQLSYAFAHEFNMPVMNQGIGGQTAAQIRARWNRDVLAMSDDPGDGRGAVTLDTGGQKPYCVFIHVGINDVFLGRSAVDIIADMQFFKDSCETNGIKLIVANIGADSVSTQTIIDKIILVNTFLDGLTSTDSFKVVDYLDWSSDGTMNHTYLKPGMFVDSVHPSKDGYASYAEYVFDNLGQVPMYLNYLEFNSSLQGPSHFTRIVGVELEGNIYSLNNEVVSSMLLKPLTNNHLLQHRVTIIDTSTVNGTQYTGLAGLTGRISNSSSLDLVLPSPIKGAGVVYQGLLDPSWKNFGVAVDLSQVTTTGEVKLNFSSRITKLQLQHIGSATSNTTLTWSSGLASSGLAEWSVYVNDNTTGAPTTVLTDIDFQFIGFAE
jgi:lysophospholipase L1-like esterase